MSADELWSLLSDEYLPFTLYADHEQGTPVADMATRLGLPVNEIAVRIEAARVGIETGQRLKLPFMSASARM